MNQPTCPSRENSVTIVSIIIALFLTLLAVILIPLTRKERKSSHTSSRREESFRSCPLCGSGLRPGERVFTESFPGRDDEKIVHLHGCPYCHGKEMTMRGRKCPVCGKKLSQGSYLRGTMWEENGKTRVHVLGCTKCSIRR